MLLTTAVFLIFALGAACLWHFRPLWRMPQARAIIIALVLMLSGLVLIFPAQEYYVGAWLHSLTGVWYINDYLSLLSLMIAVNYLVKFTALVSPEIDDEQTAWRMRQVSRPSIGAAAFMLLMLATSPVARKSTWQGPIMDLPVGSLWAMWFPYALVQIWCLLFLLQLLWMLRETAHNRESIYWFMATAVTGIATEGVVIAAQYIGSLFTLRWYGTLSAVLFALIGGLRSWRGRDRDPK